MSITKRPAEVETREQLGDWEGDTVHGVGGNLVTLVERRSGYLSAYPVKRRTRRQVTRAINLQFNGHVVHTLTLDNGKEFAGHGLVDAGHLSTRDTDRDYLILSIFQRRREFLQKLLNEFGY